MSKEGYILDLYKSGIISKKISAQSKQCLQVILQSKKPLTAYDIVKILRNSPNETAYKNVHKKLLKLEELSFIEQVRFGGKPKHKSVRYRLSSFGLFYILCKGSEIIFSDPNVGSEKDFISNYTSDELFKIFIDEVIDIDTLNKLEGYDAAYAIVTYLQEKSREIENYLKHIAVVEKNSGVNRILGYWDEILKQDSIVINNIKEFLVRKFNVNSLVLIPEFNQDNLNEITFCTAKGKFVFRFDRFSKKVKVFFQNKLKEEIDVRFADWKPYLVEFIPMTDLEEHIISSYYAKDYESEYLRLSAPDVQLVLNLIQFRTLDSSEQKFHDLYTLSRDEKFKKLFSKVETRIQDCIDGFKETIDIK